jgi:hypothetical protein
MVKLAMEIGFTQVVHFFCTGIFFTGLDWMGKFMWDCTQSDLEETIIWSSFRQTEHATK